jgi:predicted RNA-binding Zn-ribbon protein involved in translation (DUF1610 family)
MPFGPRVTSARMRGMHDQRAHTIDANARPVAYGRDVWLRAAVAAGLGLRRLAVLPQTSVRSVPLRRHLAEGRQMYFEMRLREFVCPDCGESFKSTSPNAVRCSACAKLWATRRNREYQRQRYANRERAKQSQPMLSEERSSQEGRL